MYAWRECVLLNTVQAMFGPRRLVLKGPVPCTRVMNVRC